MSINLRSGRAFAYSIFISRYVGLNFGEEFTLKIENEYVKSIHLEAVPREEDDECELIVTLYLKDSDERMSVSDIWTRIEDFLELLSDYLSFEFGLPIKKIEWPGSKLFGKIQVIKHFNEEHKIKMEKEISDIKYEPYKRLYRSAMSSDDNVARFMFLYSILFDVLEAEDKNGQRTVDAFIRNECKRIDENFVYKHFEDRPSEKKDKNGVSKRNETIYTWLRNQVGHTQFGSRIISVTSQIDVKVKELELIVAKAINMYAS